jgi:hypothetical protein
MQVAGIRGVGARVEMIELGGPRPLAIPVAASYGLADAARALAQVTGGHAAGAIVLTP